MRLVSDNPLPCPACGTLRLRAAAAHDRWVAIIEADGDDFCASFPDFPGLRVRGDGFRATVDLAAAALGHHLARLLGCGEPFPPARALAEILPAPEACSPQLWVIEVAAPAVREARPRRVLLPTG